jgi:hypothetical protein
MLGLIPSWVKVAGACAVVAIISVVLFDLRHELIEKGKNIVYAQDYAETIKAQKEQAKKDAKLIEDQTSYIIALENSKTTVKEKVRVVQAPCDKDGRGDPRLDDAADWVRNRLLPPGPGQAPGLR